MSVPTRHVIVGTAGHIDHGKTALVKALTGVDTDTLAEEKRRGITIELGFAFLDTPDPQRQIVFIDVPGHEKLIKTMVAGASHIDAALLVVAADEGVSLQTIEHFDILRVLAIPTGIIALTKCDLTDAERIERVRAEVEELTRGSFLEKAQVIPVSAVTGEGLPDLRTALFDLASAVPDRAKDGPFRMPIDRVFTVRGFGTVVAGTVLSGEIRTGDRLQILPEGILARVRGLQVRSRHVEVSSTGLRTAVNLQDVRRDQLRRGQTACTPGAFRPTKLVDARLEVLRSFGEELRNRTRVRFHTGTDEVMARVVVLDRDRVEPGGSALVQLALESETVAVPMDRFVIRTFSPMRTIGGGTILDAAPARHRRGDPSVLESLAKREGSTADKLEQVLLRSGREPLNLEQIAAAVGESAQEVSRALEVLCANGRVVGIAPGSEGNAATDVQAGLFVHADCFSQFAGELKGILNDFYAKNPYRVTVPVADLRSRFAKRADIRLFEPIVRRLLRSGELAIRGTRIGLVGREPSWRTGQKKLAERVALIYEEAGFAAPPEEEVRAELNIAPDWFEGIMTALIDQDVLVRLSDRVTYHAKHAKAAQELVVQHIRDKGGITAAELRDLLGLSRKYAISILEYLDSTGCTRRVGDRRVLRNPGPNKQKRGGKDGEVD